MSEVRTFPNGATAIMTFGIGLPPYTHGNVRCLSCDTVVARCGCSQGCMTVATVAFCVSCACSTEHAPGDPAVLSLNSSDDVLKNRSES